jgi:hypothetical protein
MFRILFGLQPSVFRCANAEAAQVNMVELAGILFRGNPTALKAIKLFIAYKKNILNFTKTSI